MTPLATLLSPEVAEDARAEMKPFSERTCEVEPWVELPWVELVDELRQTNELSRLARALAA